MGVSSTVYVIDATVVDAIHADFSMAMDDVVVGQKNANMNDFALFIVKKCEVSGFALFNKTQNFTLAGLLMGIPVKHVSVYFVDHLGETGAIDATFGGGDCGRAWARSFRAAVGRSAAATTVLRRRTQTDACRLGGVLQGCRGAGFSHTVSRGEDS